MYEFFPDMEMFSIEEDEETFKRQKFHRPSCTVKLLNRDMKTFLAKDYEPKNKKSIFWLDYSGLDIGNFLDFKVVLTKSSPKSIVKITLEADPKDYRSPYREEVKEKYDKFYKMFSEFLPNHSEHILQRRLRELPNLLQDMLRIASQQALPGGSPKMFQPVSSFFYNDGTQMFTLTGVVCQREKASEIEQALRNWKFANLEWNKPKKIDVPTLSTKERLHLATKLPCSKNPGKTLCKALGYLIDDDQASSEQKLEQYSEFHRHFPYFIRGIP